MVYHESAANEVGNWFVAPCTGSEQIGNVCFRSLSGVDFGAHDAVGSGVK